MFGGFILHFLLSNYLTVLLRPRYEEPVETAADLIKRDITPFLWPDAEGWRESYAASPDPDYQEISRRLVIAKDWDDYEDMISKVISTGMFADIGTIPWVYEEEFKDWYRSSKTLAGDHPYAGHLANKKWPLKKVSTVKLHDKKQFLKFYFQQYDLNTLRFTQVYGLEDV